MEATEVVGDGKIRRNPDTTATVQNTAQTAQRSHSTPTREPETGIPMSTSDPLKSQTPSSMGGSRIDAVSDAKVANTDSSLVERVPGTESTRSASQSTCSLATPLAPREDGNDHDESSAMTYHPRAPLPTSAPAPVAPAPNPTLTAKSPSQSGTLPLLSTTSAPTSTLAKTNSGATSQPSVPAVGSLSGSTSGGVSKEVQPDVPGQQSNVPRSTGLADALEAQQQAVVEFDEKEAAIRKQRQPLIDAYGPYVNPEDTCLKDIRNRLRISIAQTRKLQEAFTERVYKKYRVCLKPPLTMQDTLIRIQTNPARARMELLEEIRRMNLEKNDEKDLAVKLGQEMNRAAEAARHVSVSATVQKSAIVHPSEAINADSADQLMYLTAGLSLIILPEDDPSSFDMTMYKDRAPINPLTQAKVKSISYASASAGEVMLDRARRAAALRSERTQRKRQHDAAQNLLKAAAASNTKEAPPPEAQKFLDSLSNFSPYDFLAAWNGKSRGLKPTPVAQAVPTAAAPSDNVAPGTDGNPKPDLSVPISTHKINQGQSFVAKQPPNLAAKLTTPSAKPNSSSAGSTSSSKAIRKVQSNTSPNILLSISPLAEEMRTDGKLSSFTQYMKQVGVGGGSSSAGGTSSGSGRAQHVMRYRHPFPESLGGRRRGQAGVGHKEVGMGILPPLPSDRDRKAAYGTTASFVESTHVPPDEASLIRAKSAIRRVADLYNSVDEGSLLALSGRSPKKAKRMPLITLRYGLSRHGTDSDQIMSESTGSLAPIDSGLAMSVLRAVGLLEEESICDEAPMKSSSVDEWDYQSFFDSFREACLGQKAPMPEELIKRQRELLEGARSFCASFSSPPQHPRGDEVSERANAPGLVAIRGGGQVLVDTAEESTGKPASCTSTPALSKDAASSAAVVASNAQPKQKPATQTGSPRRANGESDPQHSSATSSPSRQSDPMAFVAQTGGNGATERPSFPVRSGSHHPTGQLFQHPSSTAMQMGSSSDRFHPPTANTIHLAQQLRHANAGMGMMSSQQQHPEIADYLHGLHRAGPGHPHATTGYDWATLNASAAAVAAVNSSMVAMGLSAHRRTFNGPDGAHLLMRGDGTVPHGMHMNHHQAHRAQMQHSQTIAFMAATNGFAPTQHPPHQAFVPMPAPAASTNHVPNQYSFPPASAPNSPSRRMSAQAERQEKGGKASSRTQRSAPATEESSVAGANTTIDSQKRGRSESEGSTKGPSPRVSNKRAKLNGENGTSVLSESNTVSPKNDAPGKRLENPSCAGPREKNSKRQIGPHAAVDDTSLDKGSEGDVGSPKTVVTGTKEPDAELSKGSGETREGIILTKQATGMKTPPVARTSNPSNDLKFSAPVIPDGLLETYAERVLQGRVDEALQSCNSGDSSTLTSILTYTIAVAAAVPIPKSWVAQVVKEKWNLAGNRASLGHMMHALPKEVVVACVLIWIWKTHEEVFQAAFARRGRIDVDPSCKFIVHTSVDTIVDHLLDEAKTSGGAFAKALNALWKARWNESDRDDEQGLRLRVEALTAKKVSRVLMRAVALPSRMDASILDYSKLLLYLDELRQSNLQSRAEERVLLASIVSRKSQMSQAFSQAYASSIVRAGEALGHGSLFEAVQNEAVGVSTMIPYDVFTDELGVWEDPCRSSPEATDNRTGDSLLRQAHARALMQKSLKKLQDRHHIKGGTPTTGPYVEIQSSGGSSDSKAGAGRGSQSQMTPRGSLKRRSSFSKPSCPAGTGSATARSMTVYESRHHSSPLVWISDAMENTPYGRRKSFTRPRSLSLSKVAYGRGKKGKGKSPRAMSVASYESSMGRESDAPPEDPRSTRELAWSEIAEEFQDVTIPKFVPRSREKPDHGPVETKAGEVILAPIVRRVDTPPPGDSDESSDEEDMGAETVLARHQQVLDEMKDKLKVVLDARQRNQDRKKKAY